MDELNSLEKQIYMLIQKADDAAVQNKDLLKNLRKLEDENSILKMKIDELELKMKNKSSYGASQLFPEGSITEEEKENLKEKISDLISRLDNHLRS